MRDVIDTRPVNRPQIFEFYRPLAEDNPAPETELEFVNPTPSSSRSLYPPRPRHRGQQGDPAIVRAGDHSATMLDLGEEGLNRRSRPRPIQYQGQEHHRRRAHPGRQVRWRGPVRSRVARKTRRKSGTKPPTSSSTPPSASRRLRWMLTFSGVRQPHWSGAGQGSIGGRAQAGKSNTRAVPPRRAPVADPAWALCVQGAAGPNAGGAWSADLCRYRPKTPAPKSTAARTANPRLSATHTG